MFYGRIICCPKCSQKFCLATLQNKDAVSAVTPGGAMSKDCPNCQIRGMRKIPLLGRVLRCPIVLEMGWATVSMSWIIVGLFVVPPFIS